MKRNKLNKLSINNNSEKRNGRDGRVKRSSRRFGEGYYIRKVRESGG
jgi:hypothetical protein